MISTSFALFLVGCFIALLSYVIGTGFVHRFTEDHCLPHEVEMKLACKWILVPPIGLVSLIIGVVLLMQTGDTAYCGGLLLTTTILYLRHFVNGFRSLVLYIAGEEMDNLILDCANSEFAIATRE